jgi:hypothetical protein
MLERKPVDQRKRGNVRMHQNGKQMLPIDSKGICS